ncbi:hypothetical protein [Myroides sp. LJL116]
MYRSEFTKYNGIMNKIMDEQDTLQVHLSSEFDDNIPKEFISYTPKQWAEYAFKNDKEYTVNYYKEGKPYCEVTFCKMYISFSYYDSLSYKTILMTVFSKYNHFEEKAYDKDKVFLSQVSWYGNLGKVLMFYSHKQKDNVYLDQWVIEDGKTVNIEQYGTADLSQHWFRSPQHYLDFDHLLEYQRLFENLPNVKKQE